MAAIKTNHLLFILILLSFAAVGNEQHARWLDNTFRIDPSIREITLFIERESPSVPVVLIKPDGSKFYYQRHPDNVSWASTPERDVITLWQPEPGPWQATGKIAGKHGITLLSVFYLQLDPLPAKLYQNEIIRLHGQLQHDSTTLDANYYLDGLSLTAQLYSRGHQAGQDPFSQAPLQLGSFKDDGSHLDAIPGDGIMTAEVVFDALPGSYLFQAEVSNGVLARHVQHNILLYPQPVRARFTAPDASGNWHMELETDSDIMTDSLTITGELINPLEQRLPISGQGRHIQLPPAHQPGNYRWQGRAYATTNDGREIQLRLNDQVIRVIPSPPDPAPPAPAPEQAASWPAWIIPAGAGTVLVVIAGAGLLWWRKRKKQKE